MKMNEATLKRVNLAIKEKGYTISNGFNNIDLVKQHGNMGVVICDLNNLTQMIDTLTEVREAIETETGFKF